MSLEDWRRQTAINLDGVFLSVKHCLPVMRKTGGGSIIMMSSLAGLRGAAGLSGYCATKGGVRLFAKAIAMECASFGDGIRVNSVHPGIIDTPIWGKIPTEATGRGQNAPIDPEERAKLATPLGRAGQAIGIAQGVLYLASDASRYVTGTELVIDGGMNAGGVRAGRYERGLTALPQPRQHLQPAITVGGQQPHLGLIILHGLHGVVADAAVGAAGVEAGLGQPRLHLLHFGQRQRALGAGERLDEGRRAQNAVAEMADRQRVVHRRIVALHRVEIRPQQERRAARDRHPHLRATHSAAETAGRRRG